MIGLVVGLVVSVLFEWHKVNGHCFQESISAYYYTPVRGYLVGALVSIGVCLFCLKGSTEPEDVLLNLAGMFAGVVALVPTPGVGACSSLPGTTTGRDLSIANNVTALIAVGAFGLLVLAGLARRHPPRGLARIGYVAVALLVIGAAVLFRADRHLFASRGHDTAAYLMFICILVVVCFNAVATPASARSPKNPYTVIAATMIVSAAGLIAAGLAGWDHWVIAIETSFIILFAGFWAIQTRELWDQGLR
jgi:hypothetical protein